MSVTIITGPAGGGKTRHAITLAHTALLGGKRVRFMTPITRQDHVRPDPQMERLFNYTQCFRQLTLQAPIPLVDIRVDEQDVLIIDEVAFERAGAHTFLGVDQHNPSWQMEFTSDEWLDLCRRMNQHDAALICVTQALPEPISVYFKQHTLEYDVIRINRYQDVKVA